MQPKCNFFIAPRKTFCLLHALGGQLDGRYGRHRQDDGKSGADAFLAGNPNLTPMTGDNPLGNGEPQPGALSLAFGGKKGVEDIGQDMLRDTLAIVRYFNGQEIGVFRGHR